LRILREKELKRIEIKKSTFSFGLFAKNLLKLNIELMTKLEIFCIIDSTG